VMEQMCKLTVCTRLHLQVSGIWQGGLLADNDMEAEVLTIALDLCVWLEVEYKAAIEGHIMVGNSTTGLINGGGSFNYVADFTWQTSTVPSLSPPLPIGLLMGPVQLVFGGQTSGYYAHAARPFPSNRRGAAALQTYKDKSFTAGEVLTWLGPKTPGDEVWDNTVRAAVVRVAYVPAPNVDSSPSSTRRANKRAPTRKQADKLFVLMELNTPEDVTRSGEFFPGSWANWSRIPQAESGWLSTQNPSAPDVPCLGMYPDEFHIMDEVRCLPAHYSARPPPLPTPPHTQLFNKMSHNKSMTTFNMARMTMGKNEPPSVLKRKLLQSGASESGASESGASEPRRSKRDRKALLCIASPHHTTPHHTTPHHTTPSPPHPTPSHPIPTPTPPHPTPPHPHLTPSQPHLTPSQSHTRTHPHTRTPAHPHTHTHTRTSSLLPPPPPLLPTHLTACPHARTHTHPHTRTPAHQHSYYLGAQSATAEHLLMGKTK
jgi:hypothetical protein